MIESIFQRVFSIKSEHRYGKNQKKIKQFLFLWPQGLMKKAEVQNTPIFVSNATIRVIIERRCFFGNC